MQTASISTLKKDLHQLSREELTDLVLNLAKSKKENKELLCYLIYEADDEAGYISQVKAETEFLFSEINRSSFYLIKKSVRKIQRNVKKYIRYSKNKETETILLLHFCECLMDMSPSIKKNTVLMNIYERQMDGILKVITALHEDLQHDYHLEFHRIKDRK